MDSCPACDRKFKGIGDFPLVHIVNVSTIRPKDIPSAVPNWYHEQLLEKETAGWNRKLLPSKVRKYFNKNPDEDRVVHSDGFVYARPWEDQKENRSRDARTSNSPKFWSKSFNFAPVIKELMRENVFVKRYFDTLEELVGHEVPTSRVIPSWKYYSNHDVYVIPHSGLELMLQLRESEEKMNNNRVTELYIHCQGPNRGRAGGASVHNLLKIGDIQYEGIIRK